MTTNALDRRSNASIDPRDYPISNDARRGIRRARAVDASFHMSRILSAGGYTESEIETVIAVVTPYLENAERPSADIVREELVRRGFAREDADVIADAF